jgi:hypothetical protein
LRWVEAHRFFCFNTLIGVVTWLFGRIELQQKFPPEEGARLVAKWQGGVSPPIQADDNVQGGLKKKKTVQQTPSCTFPKEGIARARASQYFFRTPIGFVTNR